MSILTATYWLKTDAITLALQAITRGQSVGNPSILTRYETRQFLNRWCAKGKVESTHTLEEGSEYVVQIQWPSRNFGKEGINYLLSVIMGGHCDIDLITQCRLMALELPEGLTQHWKPPYYGLQGIRTLLGVWNRPLLCGIIKPKIGLTPVQLAEVVQQMIDGGCDVIKEDEILADQYWCPLARRLSHVAPILEQSQALYLACITADGSETWRRARGVMRYGTHFGVHCNLWAGLGTYRDIAYHVSCPIFFQKSGDKVWTTGPFAIDYTVICQLAHLAGCDLAHVGMYGGYLAESVDVLRRRMAALQTTIPSFSCGMTPELAEQIIARFGSDLMITSGGWIHGQAEGITAATRQLRHALTTRSPLSV